MSEHIVPVKTYVAVFISLLFFTGLTTKVAYIDLGTTAIGKTHVIDWNTVAALAIAVAKMLARCALLHACEIQPGINAARNRCRILLARYHDCFDAFR